MCVCVCGGGGLRGKQEPVLLSNSTLNWRPIATKITTLVMSVRKVADTDFSYHHFHGSRDTVK